MGSRFQVTKKCQIYSTISLLTKFEDIQKNFTDSPTDPITVLEKLIPKPDLKFSLKPISIKRTYAIIQNMNNTNARGYDDITSNAIKEIQQPNVTLDDVSDKLCNSDKNASDPKTRKAEISQYKLQADSEPISAEKFIEDYMKNEV